MLLAAAFVPCRGCVHSSPPHALMEKVESFRAELAKRVLKWPKHHSNTAALIVVGMQTVRSTILERKLGFLQKVLNARFKVCEWQAGGSDV